MRPPAPCSSSRCVLATFQPLFSPPIERERGHAHVVEEHGVLHAAVGAALAARAHELHRLHLHAGQIRVDHEPAEVLVPLALRIGARDQPDAIGAVVAAHENFLAVQHVLVAVAERRHADAGEIRARAGLAQELPRADETAVDRREERLLLLLGAPDEDRRRAEAAAAVVVRRQREIEAVDLLLQDHRVVEVHPAAAVGDGGAGKQPALFAELPTELAQRAIPLVVVLGRDGDARGARRHVRGEPGAHIGAKALLLLGVRDLEIHVAPSRTAVADRDDEAPRAELSAPLQGPPPSPRAAKPHGEAVIRPGRLPRCARRPSARGAAAAGARRRTRSAGP